MLAFALLENDWQLYGDKLSFVNLKVGVRNGSVWHCGDRPLSGIGI